MTTIVMQEDAARVLLTIASFHRQGDPKEVKGLYQLDGSLLCRLADESPERINDAVELLERCRFVEVARYIGSAPFRFQSVQLTARGRIEAGRMLQHDSWPSGKPVPFQSSILPVGCPSGLSQKDWERIAYCRAEKERLMVVFVRPCKSDDFNAWTLERNIKQMFEDALSWISTDYGVVLDFKSLFDDIGRRPFGETACDIISSDMAVFETSNLDVDVMLAMGVALTWGTRVFPVCRVGSKRPSLDIPVHAWAEYRGDGAEWPDADLPRKLVSMIQLSLMRKGVSIFRKENSDSSKSGPAEKGSFGPTTAHSGAQTYLSRDIVKV